MATSSKPEIPTVQEMTTWDVDRLLRWIQQKPDILEGDHLEQFKEIGIDGDAFLLASFKFFHKVCRLSPVVSSKLKSLADEVKEKGKFIPRT